jgi:carbon-monoxide dehydrogenase medium subunit
MIPAAFDYAAPATLDEALRMLSERGDEAKVLAGGHSLIPAMKLRLAQPAMLIDIGRLKDLAYIREEGGGLLIGAMTTHHQLEADARVREVCPVLSECAAAIGDVQVRNRGTIGGSLAHADPAADWPAAVLALDAEIVAVSASGERRLTAEEFFVEMLTTALNPDEILREVRAPLPPAGAGQAYLKVAQPASGFAVVGVAAVVGRGADGSCQTARVAVTGVAAKAYRARAVEDALAGQPLDAPSIAAAAAHAADGVDANSDLYASAAYRSHLARVYTRRAVELAASRCQ